MDLASLRAVLAPLTKFGTDEDTFEVEGTKVEIRPLLPREEIACQQFSAATMVEAHREEGAEDADPLTTGAAMRFFDQFRIEVISYALVGVNGTSLRFTEVETGEVLENGVKVKIPKNVAIRTILDGWSRAMITITFAKYGDLMVKIATKASKFTEDSVNEIEAEISRTKTRLEELEEELERRAKGDPSVTASQIMALVDAGRLMEQEVADAAHAALADQAAAARIRAAARDAAPSEPPVQEEAPAPEPVRAPVAAAPPRRPITPRTSPPPGPAHPPQQFTSSFMDPDEEGGSAAEEIRAELARQARLRVQRHAVPQENEDVQEEAVPLPRVGQREGFALPPMTLSARKVDAPAPRGSGKLDPPPDTGAANPNFRRK